ncbi:MAG: LPS export ABC transporter periplasmic protein LptC [Pseudomonadota bacterium]
MAPPSDRYSRFVAWIKIILPLAALGLLSSLALLSRNINPEAAIPFAEVDVRGLAQDQGINAATYSGVTRSGAAVTMSVRSVLPDATRPPATGASDVRANVTLENGRLFQLIARAGRFDPSGQTLNLTGGVHLSSDGEFHLTSARLEISLRDSQLASPGPVRIVAPFGRITAGKMTAAQDGQADTGYIVLLQNGVKLIYEPD